MSRGRYIVSAVRPLQRYQPWIIGFVIGVAGGASYLSQSPSPEQLASGLQAERVKDFPALSNDYAQPWSIEDGLRLASNGEWSEALDILKPAALEGHPAAQLAVGSMYFHGHGLPKNEAEAMRWWQLAGQQGNAAAAKKLAYLHYSGVGTPKNLAETRRWFIRAADAGDAAAQEAAGVMLLDGVGGLSDPQSGVAYLRKAAAGGSTIAQQLLREIEPQIAFESMARSISAAQGGKISMNQLRAVAQMVGAQYGTARIAPSDPEGAQPYDAAGRALESITSSMQPSANGVSSGPRYSNIYQDHSRRASNASGLDSYQDEVVGSRAFTSSQLAGSEGSPSPRPPSGLIEHGSGQYMPPAAGGYVDPRNGTFYSHAGPNGVVNTRTGEFRPTQ